jgi:hypothetical protein
MSTRTMQRLACSVMLCASACLAFGCGNDERPPSEPAPVAPPPAPAAPAAAPSVPDSQDPSAEELPLPEDFEPEAEQQINDSNFKSQLDAIEKEMDAEK